MYIEITLLLLVVCFVAKKFFCSAHRGRLMPGEYGWPLIGYIPPSNLTFLELVKELTRKHGKIFSSIKHAEEKVSRPRMKVGCRNFVFISDFKALKEAFTSPLSTNRPVAFSFEVLSGYKRQGFVNTIGHSNQNFRRFTLAHLRNSGMGKSSMENAIIYELQCLIDDFKKYTGKPVEIPWSLNVAVINTLWKVLADVRLDIADKKIQDFEKLVTDIFMYSQHSLFILFDNYPFLPKIIPRALQSKLGLKGFFDAWDKIKNFLREAIENHESSLDKENPRDYIDAFLLQIKGENNEKNNNNFSREQLLYCLSDLFLAGSETTSSTFRWVLLYLVKYPEIQKKVHEEIDKALPRDRLPTLSDKDRLVYTQAVINETLRLSPVAMFGLYHSFDEDIEINGYCISKDDVVFPAIALIQRDPDYWEDPETFKPERFITADEKLDTNKEGFLPFSLGRRNCIGESLARMELFFLVVGILQTFNFAAPEGVEMSTKPDHNRPFFLIPSPFKLIMTVREENAI